MAGRGCLRRLLGRVTGASPAAIRFSYSEHGKPLLANPARDDLRFNASGAGSLALIALRLYSEVGVDVERRREFSDREALAKRLLAAAELLEFASLAESDRDMRLLEYWVRKEAVAKSLGLGLRQSFAGLAVGPHDSGSPREIAVEAGNRKATNWLASLPAPREGFVAAVASSAPIANVRCCWGDA